MKKLILLFVLALLIQFIVYSTSVRPIESENYYNTSRELARVLNPTISSNLQINVIEFALSQDPDFLNQSLFTKPLDSVSTTLVLNNLLPDSRYYWRARLKGATKEWSQAISFFNNFNYSWFINNSFNPEDIIQNKVEFDSI